MLDLSRQTPDSHPLALPSIAFTSIVFGGVIGATTNAINGAVSPEYFRQIMRWHHVDHIWRASVAQGIFEGLIYGFIFSIIFTLVVGRVSSGRCSYRTALAHLLAIVVSIYICWILGGLCGVGLASLSREFYRYTFHGVPEDDPGMLRFAWVGGSIWGAIFGGLLACVVGSLWFAANWRKSDGPFPVSGK